MTCQRLAKEVCPVVVALLKETFAGAVPGVRESRRRTAAQLGIRRQAAADRGTNHCSVFGYDKAKEQ